ncbi:MAG TPA: Sec-independent protein translocase protein TatB [Usitatibacter sp.]|jgi:sec-independent protein translocase protein TatB|nr:Sec-independent protein translocase protein TatB [Usitatibacter sp.]
MFDVGFSELVVIGIVALVVIGPERLPRVARTAGVLFGRLQRYVAQVKADIGREIEMSDLKHAKTEFEDAARSFKAEVEAKGAEVEREIRDAQAQVERDLASKSGVAQAEAVAAAASPGLVPPPAQPSLEPSPQLELDMDEPRQPPRP